MKIKFRRVCAAAHPTDQCCLTKACGSVILHHNPTMGPQTHQVISRKALGPSPILARRVSEGAESHGFSGLVPRLRVGLGCLPLSLLTLVPRSRVGLGCLPFSLLTLILLLSAGFSTSLADQKKIADQDAVLVVPQLVITPLHSAAVPAPLAGVLRSVAAGDGAAVAERQELAQLDAAEAESVHQQAVAEAEVADRLAADTSAVDLARQELALAKQMLDKQQLQVAKADQQAANELPEQAAEKAAKVAQNELQRATAARQRFTDSVSQSEIDGLTLAHQRAVLESQQARLQRTLDDFGARIERQTAGELETSHRAAELRLTQRQFEQSVLQLRAAAVRAQADRAGLLVRRHRITAPLDGVVAETLRQPGEWVQPGDTIFRIVGLSQLRAEGFLTGDQAAQLRQWQSTGGRLLVRLQIDSAADAGQPPLVVPGQLGFISPEVDAINHQVRFWVTLENESRRVYPGMKASVTIQRERQP